MRVAVASSGLGHISRGIETWADDLAGALYRAGEDVTLFQAAGEAADPWRVVVPCWKRFDRRTERIVRSFRGLGGWRYGLGSGYQAEQSSFAWHLWHHVRTDFDILHVQDPWLGLILDRLHRLRLSRPRVVLAHGTEEAASTLAKYSFLQHLAPNYDQDWQRHRPQRQFSTAVPNFVDVKRFSPGRRADCRAKWKLPQEGLVVLCVAAIKRSHKRCDYILHEFERFLSVSGAPATLVMVGARESETDEIISLGQQLLGEHVRFLQSVPRAELPDIYRAANVFVIGSLHEMMPIAVLEALSSGLPVVANNTSTLTWMVGDGGITPDLSQPGALSAALHSMMDAEWGDSLSIRARRRAESVFSSDVVVARVIEMYREVLAWPAAALDRSSEPLITGAGH